MKSSQRKQAIVKLNNKEEGEIFIQQLEKFGLKNVHHITFENLRIKVLVVTHTEFFSINTTCLAALVSSGIKPISVDEYTSFETIM